MAQHKVVSFAIIVALFILVTLLIKLIQILLKWKYMQGKTLPFRPPCSESKANLTNWFRPANRAAVFRFGNFHPGCRDLVFYRADPPSHMKPTPKRSFL